MIFLDFLKFARDLFSFFSYPVCNCFKLFLSVNKGYLLHFFSLIILDVFLFFILFFSSLYFCRFQFFLCFVQGGFCGFFFCIMAGQYFLYGLWPEVPTTSGRGCFVTSQTDRHTDKQTDMATLWLNRPSGPFCGNQVFISNRLGIRVFKHI